MSKDNYFVKLLLFLLADGKYRLIYGFSIKTEQPQRGWKTSRLHDSRYITATAYLSESDAVEFADYLTLSNDIELSKKLTVASPNLVRRNTVYYNEDGARMGTQFSDYLKVCEYWNVQKRETINEVTEAFGSTKAEQYISIKEIIKWIRSESGINLSNQGQLFGNFEFFNMPEHGNDFELITDCNKQCGKVVVTKLTDSEESFIINCMIKNCGRNVLNQAVILSCENKTQVFYSHEPIGCVEVKIWSADSGDLVFAEQISLIREIKLQMNIKSTLERYTDKWSEKLAKSASGKKDDVRNRVETVKKYSNDMSFSINNHLTCIELANEEGLSIFSNYMIADPKGAFLPNINKDGEIDSFIKIREYMSDDQVERVILADPYFDVSAASKILMRLPKTDVKVEVLLSPREADSVNDNSKSIAEELSGFLNSIAGYIQNNLKVIYLHRGKKPVFHDRYLLRFLKNGMIDGFLLSNSINTMGQYYPLVIAPMEQEVVLQVLDYLEDLQSPEKQKKKHDESITCEILYDCHAYSPLVHIPTESLPLYDWLKDLCVDEKSLKHIDVFHAISAILEHSSEDRELTCKTLCSLCCNVDNPPYVKIAEYIKNIGYSDEFIEVFSSLANQHDDYERIKSKSSRPNIIWMLFRGNAEISRQGYNLISQECGHVYYAESWLYGGYGILIKLSPEKYIELMDSIWSPMMFDILVLESNFYCWNGNTFKAVLTKSCRPFVQLILTDQTIREIESGSVSFDKVDEVLCSVGFKACSVQSAYLISQITFKLRAAKNISEGLYYLFNNVTDRLFKILSESIVKLDDNGVDEAIKWLFDCEPLSCCNLYLRLIGMIDDERIKNKLFKCAEIESTSEFKKSVIMCSFDELVSVYLKCKINLYRESTEAHILKDIADWEDFEAATEPRLKDYSYEKWSRAFRLAKVKFRVLKAYYGMNPNASKTKNWIDYWEHRIDLVINSNN